jgi:hypothetical protein
MEAEKLFSVFFDKFLEEEQVVKKGKSHTQEVLQLLETLKLMIRNLAENIAKRWKFQMFARIVLKTLYRGNLLEVRMSAFECLLLLMDIFGDDPDDNVQGFTIPAFATAIDLSPFTGEDSAQLNDPEALCPATEPLTKDDVASMWEYLLTFATQREDNFEFWYELLKTNYLSIFYADECMSIGLPVAQKTTFAVCPPEMQVKIIKHLPTWDSHKYLQRTIWSEVNAPIMLGFCTHACKMPLFYSRETVECITLFNSVFLRKTSADDPMKHHWRNWLTSVSRVFFIPSQAASAELTTHVSLCEMVIDIFTYFVVDLAAEMEENHWIGFQTLLVDVVYELLSTNDATLVQTLAEVMSNSLLDVMFIAWIRSPFTTGEMWSMFQKKLSRLLAWKPLILQWQEKILMLTSVSVNLLYAQRQTIGSVVSVGSKKGRRTTFFGGGSDKVQARDDLRVSGMDWTPESIEYMWYSILHVLGDPVEIVTGELFQLSLGCIASIIDTLQQAQMDFFPDEREDPPPIDVFKVFCPWLFGATQVDSKRSRGAIVAYTLLCELFLQMRDTSFDPALLSHFYRVLISGLTGGHSAISWCVIRNCRSLFWLDLPGAEVVMPFILDLVDTTFGPKGVKNPAPEKVQTRFVGLICGMICYSSHYQQFCATDADLFDRVVDALILIAKFPKIAVPKSLCSALCGLSSCIFQEVLDQRRATVISSCITTIIKSVIHENAEVSTVALQSLGSLSHILTGMQEIDPMLAHNLVAGLCAAGHAMLHQDRNSVVVAILYTILEILLAGDTHEMRVAKAIFGLCDAAMCHHRPDATAKRVSISLSRASGSANKVTKEPKEDQQKRGGFVGKLRKKEKAGVVAEPEPEHQLPPDVLEVQDAGETVAQMLCAHLDNFPALAGPEISECREYDGKKHQGDDDMNPNTIFWIFGNNSLLSMRQVDPCTAGPIVRVTLRNMTGRFVWDCKLEYEKLRESYEYGLPLAAAYDDPTFEDMMERKTANMIDMERTPRPAGTLPTADIDFQHDGLFETLSYLHESHPVIVPSVNVPFTQPYETYSIDEEEMSFYETSLEFQDEDEQMHLHSETRGCARIVPHEVPTESSFHWARLFFAQMGFTNQQVLEMDLCLVDNSDKFRRTLKELDKRQVREHVKVACLRVARGHETQKEMLHSEDRSVGFRDLVDAMAWSVDLASHVGFGGQLPKRNSAPYWATPSTELVFHDTTRMPTDQADEQQIQKKKHVGNDHVSVIYSEHYAEYDPEVIKSQFNFVHVIIYPLINGLHRVQIKKKDKIPFFGPLVDGSLVSPSVLPPLVRATVINANRVVRIATTQGSIVRPVQARAKLLQEIAVKYRKEVDFQGMMMELMSVNITPGYEPPSEPEESSLSIEKGRATSPRRKPRQASRPAPPAKDAAAKKTRLPTKPTLARGTGRSTTR